MAHVLDPWKNVGTPVSENFERSTEHLFMKQENVAMKIKSKSSEIKLLFKNGIKSKPCDRIGIKLSRPRKMFALRL